MSGNPAAWRARIMAIAVEAAERYGARVYEVDGITVFNVPHADQYCVLLTFRGRNGSAHDLAITFDAEALAVADESGPASLSAAIEARIAYEVGRYFAALGEPWRPHDEG